MNAERIELFNLLTVHNFKPIIDQPPYRIYQRTFLMSGGHALLRFTVCENDQCADIALSTCPSGYGALESQWRGINVGHHPTAQSVIALYNHFVAIHGEPM